MTPLAWELFEDVCTPSGIHIAEWPFGHADDPKNRDKTRRLLWQILNQAKFVEMTKVMALTGQLAHGMYNAYEDYDRVDTRLAFLPAPCTWIETYNPSIKGLIDDEERRELTNTFFQIGDERERIKHWYRTAVVFMANDSTHTADRFRIQYQTPRDPAKPRVWRVKHLSVLPLVHSGLKPARSYEHVGADGHVRRFEKPVAWVHDFIDYANLALINSPRIIGQRGHYPHGRIERNALKNAKMVGKFPLRAWTEIVLEITTNPQDRSGDAPKEMHLTGERCLHYCRTYLRVRLGMLEYVEGHWRGNPALGIKRSRYRVEPEKQS
jgi:hypothetical protein